MIWAEIITGVAGFGVANYGLYRLGMWSARKDLRETMLQLEKLNKDENAKLLKECQEHLKHMEEINSKGLLWLGKQNEDVGGLDTPLLNIQEE